MGNYMPRVFTPRYTYVVEPSTKHDSTETIIQNSLDTNKIKCSADLTKTIYEKSNETLPSLCEEKVENVTTLTAAEEDSSPSKEILQDKSQNTSNKENVETKVEENVEEKIEEKKVEEKLEENVEEKVEEKLEENVETKVEEKVEEKLEEKVETKVEEKVEEKVEKKVELDRIVKSKYHPWKSHKKCNKNYKCSE